LAISCSLLKQRRLVPGLEREVIEGGPHAESAVDSGIVLGGYAWYAARLHERDQLIAAG